MQRTPLWNVGFNCVIGESRGEAVWGVKATECKYLNVRAADTGVWVQRGHVRSGTCACLNPFGQELDQVTSRGTVVIIHGAQNDKLGIVVLRSGKVRWHSCDEASSTQRYSHHYYVFV